MVKTRAAEALRLRNRYVNKREFQVLECKRKKRWAPPNYADWPKQEDGAAYVRFVREQFARFKANAPKRWKDGCAQPNNGGPKKLLAYQNWIKYVIAPNTTTKRMLVAASTGSGKTMVMVQLLCNFVDTSLYPALRSTPTSIVLVTQSQTLKTELLRTIEKEAACVRSAVLLEGMPPLELGRMKLENHPYWWAEKWLREKSKITPISVMTYAQAARQPASHWNNAVVILDEAHTLVDTSALIPAQRGFVKTFREKLEKAVPNVLVGLTGSPLGQSWRDFVDLHNVFANPADRMSHDEFSAMFLNETTIDDSKTLLKCLGKGAFADKVYEWAPASPDAVNALAMKIAPYLFYYDGSQDRTRFADVVQKEEVIEPSASFVHNALKTGRKKMRESFARTRLVAAEKMVGTASILKDAIDLDRLEQISPVTYALIRNLANRKGKAVIYSDVQNAFGAEFIAQILRKFSDIVFGGTDAPLLFQMSNDQTVNQRTNILKTFNEHKGLRKDSAILVLGPQFSTGIDVRGAVREMHLLNALPNDALEIQARGRVRRMCSHAGLQHDQWSITYWRYKTNFQDVETGIKSCDNTIDSYRAKADTVMQALRSLLLQSAIGCPGLAGLHRHGIEACADVAKKDLSA